MTDSVVIRSPRHYSTLLMDPNPVVRHEALALLIGGHPDALRFARAEGSYAFEALSGQLESSIASDDDLQLLQALDRLDDSRASDDFVRVLMYASHPEALELAAAALARWQGTGSLWLGNALHDPHRPHLHTLVARHIASEAPARDAVRAALVQIESENLDPLAAPDVGDDTFTPSYLEELRGPYATAVRRVAEAHGHGAFAALVDPFDRLAAADQSWLLHWGARLRSLPAINLFDRLLASEGTPAPLLATALEAVAALGPLAATLTVRLEQVSRRHADAAATSPEVSRALTSALQAATGGPA
jgi:hypothetical protein